MFDLNEARSRWCGRGIRGHGPRCGRVGVFGAPRGDREGGRRQSTRMGVECLRSPTSAPGEQKEHEGEAH